MTDQPKAGTPTTTPAPPAPTTDGADTTDGAVTAGPGRYGLPRALIITLGLAGSVVIGAGLQAISEIIGPVFLALVLTVTVDPIRVWLIRHGWSRALASFTVFLIVMLIIVGLLVAAVFGLVQLATLMPQYADQIQQELAGVRSWLAGLGVTTSDIQSMLSSISPEQILTAAGDLVNSVSGVLSFVLFVLVVAIFLGADSITFTERMAKVRPGRNRVLDALGVFAKGTRKYFGVATIFGGIVAILDGVALVIMGIPAAGLWALLSFVTNYIPNVGFVIGLIPPTILGFLVGGPQLAIAVIVVYSLLNFIIQSVLQPKFVGEAVGLTTTVSFLSLIVWTYLLGPIGAILAIPASLLIKALLVDMDPDAQWLDLFLGDKPVFKTRKEPNIAAGHDSEGSDPPPSTHS
ncbi:MAG: AI-2E family transporter [Mycobacterium sp.]|jgi:AI-2 transport protein TqsA